MGSGIRESARAIVRAAHGGRKTRSRLDHRIATRKGAASRGLSQFGWRRVEVRLDEHRERRDVDLDALRLAGADIREAAPKSSDSCLTGTNERRWCGVRPPRRAPRDAPRRVADVGAPSGSSGSAARAHASSGRA